MMAFLIDYSSAWALPSLLLLNYVVARHVLINGRLAECFTEHAHADDRVGHLVVDPVHCLRVE